MSRVDRPDLGVTMAELPEWGKCLQKKKQNWFRRRRKENHHKIEAILGCKTNSKLLWARVRVRSYPNIDKLSVTVMDPQYIVSVPVLGLLANKEKQTNFHLCCSWFLPYMYADMCVCFYSYTVFLSSYNISIFSSVKTEKNESYCIVQFTLFLEKRFLSKFVFLLLNN